MEKNKCQKKEWYPSRKIAKKAMKAINNRSRFMQLKTSYFCDECNGWHNTSQPPAFSRELNRNLNKKNC